MLPASATPVETGHRHDPDPFRVAARLGGVIPSRNEEDLDPGARAPIIFCLIPPICPTLPSSSIAPVTAMRFAVVDVASELLEDIEGEGEPGGRAATPPASISDVDRQLDVGGLRTRRR